MTILKPLKQPGVTTSDYEGFKMTTLCKNLLEGTVNRLACIRFQARHKRRPTDFTRRRKIGFAMIIRFLLSFVRKSLQLEVDHFYDLLGKPARDRATMDAFIKAREKVKPSAFIEFFEMSADMVLASDEVPTTNGYRVFAIDGSMILVQASPDILMHVDPSPNNPGRCAARVSVLCEVRTGLVVDATIGPLRESERSMAMRHLARFFARRGPRDVVLFDRGYPSKELMAHFVSQGAFFLMRMQRSFNRQIDDAPLGESAIPITYKDVVMPLRVCKFPLPGSEVEILITNLPEHDFPTEALFCLYAQRWGVETQYDTLKNRLELERFSGRKWDYILQDFFATMYLSNIVAASAATVNDEIARREANKPYKHTHAVSKNVLIGKLKDRLLLAFAASTPLGRWRRMRRIFKDASKAYDCVRPNRSVPRRSKRETHHKTSSPRKRSL